VAEMSNVSLLRELAVLLAEMRQFQYLQLQTTQKQLIIQAVNSSSPDNHMMNESMQLSSSIDNFAAGAPISDPVAPTSESIAAQTAEASAGFGEPPPLPDVR
jgi:flagellar basal body rod protein FlgG